MKPYYKQLLEGCGNPKCRHPLCAGISGDVSNLEKNGLTRESAKSLADRLEKMTRGYFCQNFCENLLKLKSEDSQESLVMLNPAAHDTSPYPVMLISSNKEGKLVHKLKEIGTDSSPIRNDSEADTRVKSTLLSNRNTDLRTNGIYETRTERRTSSEIRLTSSHGNNNTLMRGESLQVKAKPARVSCDTINLMTDKGDKVYASPTLKGINQIKGLKHLMSRVMSCDSIAASKTFPSNTYSPEISCQKTKYFGLPLLTLDLIAALIRKKGSIDSGKFYMFEATSDRDFLARSVEHVFSNNVALCSSFLVNEGGVNIDESPGIDYESLKGAYEILNNLIPHELFRDRILACSEKLLIDDIFNLKCTSCIGPRYMRKYIIILENSYIWESSSSLRFGRFMSRILASMKKRNKNILMRWLSSIESDRIVKYIKVFNNCVTNDFQTSVDQSIEYIRDPLKVLKMLFVSNQRRKKYCKAINNNVHEVFGGNNDRYAASKYDAVPISLFYNTRISNELDYKKQYKLLMGTSDDKDSSPEDSILNYTFLLNPLGKTRLMRVDAVFQMLNKYGRAFINMEIINRTCSLFESQFFSMNVPTGLNDEITPFLILEIRRDRIMEDTISQIFQKFNSLKKPLKVKFVDSGEIGVDQGGIQKEFFQIVVDKFLSPMYGIFTYDEETRISWINGLSRERLSSFQAFGIIQGLALYNGAILRLNFPQAMYKKLLDESLDLDDLKSVFLSMGNSLQELLDYEHDDFEDVFLLDFTVSTEAFGIVDVSPLVKNGDNVPVTKENREKYVSLVIENTLVKRCKKQFEAYKSGFYSVLNKDIVKITSHNELELMICGAEPGDVDFAELRSNTIYADGYTGSSQVIKWFWEILLNEFTLKQKMLFLTFCTASDRIPLGGLRMLKFTISRNGPDADRLPTSMTCFSTLMLPEYSTKDKLKSCLLTAMQCSSGFGLV